MTDAAPETFDDEPPAETSSAADGVAELQAEIAGLHEKMLRVAADAENAKRRAEKEANDARAYAIQRFAKDLLDAADNLGRAVQHAPKDVADPAIKNLVMGVEMTEKALQSAFERNGLKRVEPARGVKFDPHLHQAMMEQAADDVPPGAITGVMQPGYELFGRTIRPALVAVTPKSAGAPPPEPPPAANAYAKDTAAEAGAAVDRRA